jgi:hypothetical protein
MRILRSWRSRKKAKNRKKKSEQENYTFWDTFFDVLTFIPELIIIPFRILFLLFRGFIRMIANIFDAI